MFKLVDLCLHLVTLAEHVLHAALRPLLLLCVNGRLQTNCEGAYQHIRACRCRAFYREKKSNVQKHVEGKWLHILQMRKN